VLGFSALQLSPDRDPLAPHADRTAGLVDLRQLVARGLLSKLPKEFLTHPPRIAAASPAERAALGYLHGNCGNCHNDEGPLAVLDMTLAQRVAAPAPDAVLRSIVGVQSQFVPAGAPAGALRLAPGHLGASVIAARMSSRNPLEQMPPLGTSAVDRDAVALVARWIESLPVHSSSN
jgi:mono/diheme cytochrome c family protein